MGSEPRKSGPKVHLLTSLFYDTMFESTEHILNEWWVLILVRTTPTGEDENRVRIHWAKNSTSSLKSTTLLARCQASWRREMEWHVHRPSQSQDCLPMFFFKAKCLCCQERVCLSLGDSGCQDWENSKHVKNSSASRLRGCNFLLKCRLCSR